MNMLLHIRLQQSNATQSQLSGLQLKITDMELHLAML